MNVDTFRTHSKNKILIIFQHNKHEYILEVSSYSVILICF